MSTTPIEPFPGATAESSIQVDSDSDCASMNEASLDSDYKPDECESTDSEGILSCVFLYFFLHFTLESDNSRACVGCDRPVLGAHTAHERPHYHEDCTAYGSAFYCNHYMHDYCLMYFRSVPRCCTFGIFIGVSEVL